MSRYPELDINFALEQVKEDDDLKTYIPDSWLLPKAGVDRRYLWNILNTFKKEFVKELVNHSHKLRHANVSVNEVAKNIAVC